MQWGGSSWSWLPKSRRDKTASVGILVQIYILYLLFSKKGRRIFESDYPDIVAATPEIKYRTSVVIWVLLGLVILAFVAAVVVPVMGRK